MELGFGLELEKERLSARTCGSCWLHLSQKRTLMNYGTWLAVLVASRVCGVDAELAERLAPLWQRIVQRVVSFFGRRPHAGRSARLRA